MLINNFDYTLITANYYLPNSIKSKEYCIDNMKPLLEIPLNMVIFTHKELYNEIYEYRANVISNHETITKYEIIELCDLELYKYKNNIKTFEPRRTPEHDIICGSKATFVLKILDQNPFNTTNFCWIDSHVETNFKKMCENFTPNILYKIFAKISDDKMHIQLMNLPEEKFIYPENRIEYYKHRRYTVSGGFYVGKAPVLNKILTKLKSIWINDVLNYYVRGDEMLFINLFYENRDDFIFSYGDYKQILNNFLKPVLNFEYIYEFLLKKLCNYNLYSETILCCNNLLKQYDKYNITIDYTIYLNLLIYKFIALYYIDQSSANIMNKYIKSLINTNKKIYESYTKNLNFYNNVLKY